MVKVHRSWRSIALALVASVRVTFADPLDLTEIEDVEDLSLPDLLERPVVVATRYYAQKPADSPILVSTVDADDIARMGYRTVGEAVRGMRGIYPTNDRSYTYLGIRGVSIPGDYNTRVAVAIDNHLINDPVYQQGAAGAELGMPMIAIDRIEMIRGGAWSIYGQSALLGAVQVVSATGASRPGLRVLSTTRADVETFGDPAGRPAIAPRGEDVQASYGVVHHGIDVFAAASYFFDPGLSAMYIPAFVEPGEPCVDGHGRERVCDGVVHGNDREEAGSAYVVVRDGALVAHALASRRDKATAMAPFGTLIGTGDGLRDDRAYLDLEYTAKRGRGDVVARVSADYYAFHDTLVYNAPRPGFLELPASRITNFDHAYGRWYGGELRGHYRWAKLGSHLRDLDVVAGASLTLAYATQQNGDRVPAADPNQPALYLDRTDRDLGEAAFAQASVRAFDHLVATAAVRADYRPDSFGLTVNPQAGLVLDGGEHGRLRASFARGFRAPTAYERFYENPTDTFEANPDLTPEHSASAELSAERYLGKHVRARLIGFQLELTDLITIGTTETGAQTSVNRGELQIDGIEGAIEGEWPELRVRANYAWQTSADGVLVVNSPHSLANVLVERSLGRVDLSFETNYIGSRRDGLGAAVDATFLSSAAVVIHDVIEQLDLGIGMANLFDVRGGTPASDASRQGTIPRDPRTLWVRLQVQLGR